MGTVVAVATLLTIGWVLVRGLRGQLRDEAADSVAEWDRTREALRRAR